MVKLEVHPAALMLPDHNEEERDSLLESLIAYGANRTVKLHPDGRIIDGRHLYNYCRELDIKCEVETIEGKDYSGWEHDYVWSTLAGRVADKGRLACIANEIRKNLVETAKERQDLGELIQQGQEKGSTAKIAAEKYGTNERYVYRAAKLEKEAPDLYKDLLAGKKGITLPKQERMVKQRQHGEKKVGGVQVDKKFKLIFGRLAGDQAVKNGYPFSDKANDEVEAWIGCPEVGMKLTVIYEDGHIYFHVAETEGSAKDYTTVTESHLNLKYELKGDYPNVKVRHNEEGPGEESPF